MSGYFTDSNGNVVLMNIICDMTRFVVDVPVPNEISATLADHFMQHVILKFGIYYLVILDDDNPFMCVFSTLCKVLNINARIFAKRNNKGILL